ncbi:DUF4237 domain-containing protein [Nakamurella antarctica]|uniref:DUF4237 domain-containing protein n=1 Tax=Nakamurella antarctica TaxID=1902245 RepID=A0A3G8ZJR2_9ACTN|nr:glycohydrolase toxin TNT-related protein [Nakamurella antarctica]AZI57428.1 DUF4237 domain-containing protein [Nakamurella antarctica]
MSAASWTEDDPELGSVDAMWAVAEELRIVAEDADSARQRLQQLHDNTSDAIWRGDSADAFRGRIADLPSHLLMLHDSYSQAADGMRTYANDVDEIQYRAGVVNQELSSAEHAHTSAASAQAGWQHPPPADPAVVLLTAPDPAASKNPHDEQVAAAQARVQAALEQRRALADDRRSADSKVKGTLHNAQDMGMHNRSGWSHFWEGVSDTLGKLTIVLVVLAVVAVVLMPALAPLAFGALMAVSAAKLGVDSGRKIAGEDVSWGEIAMDALGVIPGGVYARAGGLAAKGAAQGVRAAEKLAPTAVAAAKSTLAAASAGVKGSAAAARAAKALAAARRPLASANQRVGDFAVSTAAGRSLGRLSGFSNPFRPEMGVPSAYSRGYERFGGMTEAKFRQTFVEPAGTPVWPAHNGSAPGTTEVKTHLPTGTQFDRFGSERGAFLGKPGDLFTARSIPPESLGKAYKTYQTTGKALPPGSHVEQSIIAPWFGQAGGGTQYVVIDISGEKVSVEKLLEWGFIK